MARLITCISLVALLVSVGCNGCGIGQPPVMTPEQWEAERNRVLSSEGD